MECRYCDCSVYLKINNHPLTQFVFIFITSIWQAAIEHDELSDCTSLKGKIIIKLFDLSACFPSISVDKHTSKIYIRHRKHPIYLYSVSLKIKPIQLHEIKSNYLGTMKQKHTNEREWIYNIITKVHNIAQETLTLTCNERNNEFSIIYLIVPLVSPHDPKNIRTDVEPDSKD